MPNPGRTDRIRRPAVAGIFYPEDGAVLAQEVRRLLEGVAPAAAAADAATAFKAPKAIVVPHAGFQYSGAVAAAAFRRLERFRGRIRTVVALGPSHRHRFRGLALPGCTAFAVPGAILGVDLDLCRRVLELPQVTVEDLAHNREHGLEVEMPFLAEVLPEAHLLPLVVGEATTDEVTEVLDAVWGGEETLILVSSDLSHYLSYEQALRADRATADAVLELEGPLEAAQACGAVPLSALLRCARSRGLQAQLLALRNSGDVTGDHARVVGYGAFAFYEP